MNQDTKISAKEALNWYSGMGVDQVIDPAKNGFDQDVDPRMVAENDVFSRHPRTPTCESNARGSSGLSPRMTLGDEKEPSLGQSESRTLADKASNLEELKSAVMNFDGCSLKKTALNTVFSDGTAKGAKYMLIGEAPGASEDEQGIPFCGASGNLLDNIISSIGISRKENAYISNSIFWRPPANRNPTEEEIEICKPFVEKHIALIKPDLLILVGATAVSALLGKQFKISKIRQEYYDYSNKYIDGSIKTTALFHPAYLLRQPAQKRAMWYDLLKIKAFIEKAI